MAIYLVLLMMNVSAWVWALIAFRHYPVLLGTAFLAYSFGLRHAVDADHIAAIDNVTRKLMQEGKRPVAVGFMFSLGHSTIVVLGSIALSATALSLQHRLDAGETYRRGGWDLGLDAVSFRNCDCQHDRFCVRCIARSGECGAGSVTLRKTLTCCWEVEDFCLVCFVPCSL